MNMSIMSSLKSNYQWVKTKLNPQAEWKKTIDPLVSDLNSLKELGNYNLNDLQGMLDMLEIATSGKFQFDHAPFGDEFVHKGTRYRAIPIELHGDGTIQVDFTIHEDDPKAKFQGGRFSVMLNKEGATQVKSKISEQLAKYNTQRQEKFKAELLIRSASQKSRMVFYSVAPDIKSEIDSIESSIKKKVGGTASVKDANRLLQILVDSLDAPIQRNFKYDGETYEIQTSIQKGKEGYIQFKLRNPTTNQTKVFETKLTKIAVLGYLRDLYVGRNVHGDQQFQALAIDNRELIAALTGLVTASKLKELANELAKGIAKANNNSTKVEIVKNSKNADRNNGPIGEPTSPDPRLIKFTQPEPYITLVDAYTASDLPENPDLFSMKNFKFFDATLSPEWVAKASKDGALITNEVKLVAGQPYIFEGATCTYEFYENNETNTSLNFDGCKILTGNHKVIDVSEFNATREALRKGVQKQVDLLKS